eukprot:31535-Pelagococcus_subviridis.AAC.8
MATLSLCASMSSLAVSRPKATLSCKPRSRVRESAETRNLARVDDASQFVAVVVAENARPRAVARPRRVDAARISPHAIASPRAPPRRASRVASLAVVPRPVDAAPASKTLADALRLSPFLIQLSSDSPDAVPRGRAPHADDARPRRARRRRGRQQHREHAPRHAPRARAHVRFPRALAVPHRPQGAQGAEGEGSQVPRPRGRGERVEQGEEEVPQRGDGEEARTSGDDEARGGRNASESRSRGSL